jgi:hypothetical protein
MGRFLLLEMNVHSQYAGLAMIQVDIDGARYQLYKICRTEIKC